MDETAQGLLNWVQDQADRMGTDYEEVLEEAQRRIDILTSQELTADDRGRLGTAIQKLESVAVRSGVDDQEWFDKVAGLLPDTQLKIDETDERIEVEGDVLGRFDVDANDELSAEEAATANAIIIEEGADSDALEAIKDKIATNAPVWLVQLINRDLSVEELAELETLVNDTLVEQGLPPIDSLDDLNTTTRDLAADLVARFIGPVEEEEVVFEPFTHLEMKFGPDFTMKTVDFEQAKSLLGFDDDMFRKTLEVADAFGMRREGGNEIAWQPVSLLMSMTDHMVSTSREERQAILGRIRTLGYEIKKMEEGEGPMNPEVANSRLQAARRQYQKLIAEWRSMSETERINGADGDGNQNLREVFDRFGAGLEMYGGIESLSMIHAVNPGLAARIWESDGNPQDVSLEDKKLAAYYVSKALPGAGSSGDVLGAALVTMGYGEAGADKFMIDLVGQVDVSRNPEKYAPDDDSSGPTRIVPDRMAVEQNARDTMEILYPTAANEDDVRAITDRVMQEAASAADDQDVNVEARIRQYVEELPQYGEFYGNKPGGVTEGQYKNVMTLGSRSMLGNEGDLTQAGALGMKSGKYQTAVGAAMGTSAAYDNSTFMGRLAQAAQITSRNT